MAQVPSRRPSEARRDRSRKRHQANGHADGGGDCCGHSPVAEAPFAAAAPAASAASAEQVQELERRDAVSGAAARLPPQLLPAVPARARRARRLPVLRKRRQGLPVTRSLALPRSGATPPAFDEARRTTHDGKRSISISRRALCCVRAHLCGGSDRLFRLMKDPTCSTILSFVLSCARPHDARRRRTGAVSRIPRKK